MNKEEKLKIYLKEYIKHEIKSMLISEARDDYDLDELLTQQYIEPEQETSFRQALENKIKRLMNYVKQYPERVAVLTFFMGILGIQKYEIQKILGTKDQDVQSLEIKQLIDKVIKRKVKPKSMLSYLYFGAKPELRKN